MEAGGFKGFDYTRNSSLFFDFIDYSRNMQVKIQFLYLLDFYSCKCRVSILVFVISDSSQHGAEYIAFLSPPCYSVFLNQAS